MRDADFFIDKRPRYYLHESFDTNNALFPSWAETKSRKRAKSFSEQQA